MQTDMLVATGQYTPELFPNESESMATHYLFDKLTRHYALVETDSLLQAFYTQYYNTVIRGQVELHLGMEELEQIMQSYFTMLENVNLSIQVVQDSIEYYLGIEVPADEEPIHSLSMQLDNLYIAKQNLAQQAEAAKGDELQNLILDNTALIPVEQNEINEQFVNTIYFSCIESDNFEFNASQEAILWSIGHQCPFAGGEAVYRARILYELIDPTVLYDDINTCLDQGIYRIGADQEHKNSAFKITGIYPNPANDRVTIFFQVADQKKIKLQLSEIAGKSILDLDITDHKGSYVLNIADFASGVYLMNLYNEFSRSSKFKLIVIK